MNDESTPKGAPESATTTISVPPREHTAWMRGQVACRVAQINALSGLPPHDVILAPLGKPSAPDSAEDTTCDRCRTYCPNGDGFWSFQVRPAPRVVLIGGLCDACAGKEGIR